MLGGPEQCPGPQIWIPESEGIRISGVGKRGGCDKEDSCTSAVDGGAITKRTGMKEPAGRRRRLARCYMLERMG